VITPGRGGAVFVGQGGRRLSPARVSQRVGAAFAAQGLTTRAHQLRHRCATMALTMPDADLLAVRDLLGHANVATTQVYTAVVAGRTAATSRALRLPA
jgi:integrase/recombinase XerC